MGQSVYNYREECFGVNIRRSDKATLTFDAARDGLNLLVKDIKSCLATLQRAEHLRKLCKKKEHTITSKASSIRK